MGSSTNRVEKMMSVTKFMKVVMKNRWLLQTIPKISESNSLRFVQKILEIEPNNFRFIDEAPPGHFYSAIPDYNEILSKEDKIFDRSKSSIPSIDLREEEQLKILEEFSKFYHEIPFPDNQKEGFRYYLDNDFYSYGDGIILYCLLRYFRPKRIIEIGSGFSSALMLDTNEMFLDRKTKFTFIEPYPKRLYSLLRTEDKTNHTVIEKKIQDVPLSIFEELSENDILFIDSSHVVKIDSDVVHILSNILPILKKNVIIHFHDVFWPFEYPKKWLEAGRAWNEGYFVKSFLQYNQAFQIIYFNSFMENNHAEVIRKNMPNVLIVPTYPMTIGNSSLWLRKVI